MVNYRCIVYDQDVALFQVEGRDKMEVAAKAANHAAALHIAELEWRFEKIYSPAKEYVLPTHHLAGWEEYARAYWAEVERST